MTLFKLLVTLIVCLATGTLSAQNLSPDVLRVEQVLRDLDNAIEFASIQVSSEGGATAFNEQVRYSRKSDGPFMAFALARLGSALIDPQPAGFGFEKDEYIVLINADGDLSVVDGWVSRGGNPSPPVLALTSGKFRLITTPTGYALPPEAFKFKAAQMGMYSLRSGSITGYTFRGTLGGKPFVFSVVGSGDNNLSEVGAECWVGYVRVNLEVGVLKLPVQIWSIVWDSATVTLHEGTKATTIDLTPPAVPKVKLSIRLDEGLLYLSVSGEDAADVEIEESPTLQGPWGPSLSLLRPPRLSSESSDLVVFPIEPSGLVRFYRPKAASKPPPVQ